ncbi:similar to Saccharomyces cerevisiae YAL046C AIM1 Protein involved in mitochondrial function or organization [Maudiozyma saulgeensis]|uniref:Similar to Saccharomyces cerevisiae YAL046C AIM1 Protein involved in mitochondrial function or organization n=1 Tax=Maudiozyma saulgeensis TaxID=1789683 RepID=A0A1X7QZ87_9SACH|nr:similar to Saccharomyces cerevisiae YAL046C AIM1 Protein involved in mitochondrial function or organization [Kazachstania saulgeensis]
MIRTTIGKNGASIKFGTSRSLIAIKASLFQTRRWTSAQTVKQGQTFETKEEETVYKKLQEALNPKQLTVHDISGGCGSMYNIVIKSDKFNTLTTIKQHKLVNGILKEEISKWHGLQLSTKKDK